MSADLQLEAIEYLGRQRHFVDTAEGCVSLFDVGSGPPALLVHGVGTNALLWRHVIAAVAADRCCIAIDLPLHGRSPLREGQPLGLTAFAQLLEGVYDELVLDAVDVVDVDTGGAVAQIFAVRHPTRLRTLALANCETHDNVPPKAVKPAVMLARAGLFAWTAARAQLRAGAARGLRRRVRAARCAAGRARAQLRRSGARHSRPRPRPRLPAVADLAARGRAAGDRARPAPPRRAGADCLGHRRRLLRRPLAHWLADRCPARPRWSSWTARDCSSPTSAPASSCLTCSTTGARRHDRHPSTPPECSCLAAQRAPARPAPARRAGTRGDPGRAGGVRGRAARPGRRRAAHQRRALTALVAGALVTGVLVRLAVRRSRWAARQLPLALGAGVVWLAVFWAVTLRAPSVTPPARPVPGQQIWQLSTGSRLAYVHFAARGGRRAAPIVFLHGGPGVSELPDIAPIFSRLAATGHDVYLYDQLGAGRSARLPDPRGYTLQRAIADLEAIRARLRARKLILIGHSWGATLAANYLARYAQHVERVVFSSPGSPNSRRGGVDGTPTSRLTFGQKLALYGRALAPRSLAGYLLTLTNPLAAHAFAGDAEMDRRFGAMFARTRPGLFCNPRLAERISSDGVGLYAFQLTAHDSRPYDPRPVLRRLHTPALILRGSCDYLSPRIAREYHQLLANSTLVRIPGAGHEAHLERPTAYLELIARFLGAASAASPTAT